MAPDELLARLRSSSPPIFARIRNERVLIDLRTLLPGEGRIVIDAIAEIVGGGAG